MKKILAIALVALCAAGFVFASGASETAQIVSTDGSTSMESVIGSLAEAYMNENPNVTVTYNPTGSGSGIAAVQEGRCDIGLSSRALHDDEVASGLTGTTLALDGIAIIVNNENPVSDLTLEQIAAMYTGEITNWSEVGGNDGQIVLIGREAGSGTRELFESFIRRHRLHIRTAFEETTPDAILNAVKINGCLAVISLRLLERDLRDKKVCVFTSSSHEWNRQFSFVYHKDKFLSPPILKFQEIVKSYDNIDYLHSLTGGVLLDG